jgi:hypothetical protein
MWLWRERLPAEEAVDRGLTRARTMSTKAFAQSQLQAIADALGDTSDGLTGSEIGHYLTTCSMGDPRHDETAPALQCVRR